MSRDDSLELFIDSNTLKFVLADIWRIIYVAKHHEAVMYFMHFKRRREKRVDKILIWLASVTSKLEDNL